MARNQVQGTFEYLISYRFEEMSDSEHDLNMWYEANNEDEALRLCLD